MIGTGGGNIYQEDPIASSVGGTLQHQPTVSLADMEWWEALENVKGTELTVTQQPDAEELHILATQGRVPGIDDQAAYETYMMESGIFDPTGPGFRNTASADGQVVATNLSLSFEESE